MRILTLKGMDSVDIINGMSDGHIIPSHWKACRRSASPDRWPDTIPGTTDSTYQAHRSIRSGGSQLTTIQQPIVPN